MGRVDMSCKDLGLDVTTWVKEGLVDYLCPSMFWGYNPTGIPKTAEFVALAKGTHVGIYPTVFPYSAWMADGPDKGPVEEKNPKIMRRYRDDIVNAALQCYAEGADGISTFNWVPHQQPGMTRLNQRADWGLGALKLQMRIHPRLRDRAALEAYQKSEALLAK